MFLFKYQTTGVLDKKFKDVVDNNFKCDNHMFEEFKYYKEQYYNLYKFNIKIINEICKLNCISIYAFYNFYVHYIDTDMFDGSLWEDDLKKYHEVALVCTLVECTSDIEKVFYIRTIHNREIY